MTATAVMTAIIIAVVVTATSGKSGMYNAGYAFGQTAAPQALTGGGGSGFGGLCASEANLLASEWQNGAALDTPAPGPFDSQGQQDFVNGCVDAYNAAAPSGEQIPQTVIQ